MPEMHVPKESKWLQFNQLMTKPQAKTKVYEVRNKKTAWFVGTISWNPGWRQYTFQANSIPTILAESCLRDIADFIKGLMEERKHG